MDTLPTTLLRRIFELACTDGGYTGNSLSLTSKAIRDASRTARFHSISLVASPRRLHCFLLLYKRELDRTPAPGTTFCIRHLYVTFPEVRKDRRNRTAYKIPPRSTSPSDAKSHSLTTPQRRLSPERHWPANGTPPRRPSPLGFIELELFLGIPEEYIPCPRERDDLLNSLEFLEAVRMLFRLVAPTLWTLAVQVGFSRHGGLQTHTFEQSFDALRELTLVGIEDTNALFADNVQSTPLFPAVTHLRVSGGLLVQPLARAVGVQIPEVSPVIVHVPGAFDPPTPPISPPPRLYRSLRYLLIRPEPMPHASGCGNPLVEYGQGIDDLRRIERRSRSLGIEVIILHPPRGWNYRDITAQAHDEWEERIEGGYGCWRLLDSDTLATHEKPC